MPLPVTANAVAQVGGGQGGQVGLRQRIFQQSGGALGVVTGQVTRSQRGDADALAGVELGAQVRLAGRQLEAGQMALHALRHVRLAAAGGQGGELLQEVQTLAPAAQVLAEDMVRQVRQAGHLGRLGDQCQRLALQACGHSGRIVGVVGPGL
jgi:hypothetical protein